MSEIDELRKEIAQQRARSLVTAAAKDWRDPEDAAALLSGRGDLDYIETAAEARQAVAEIAKPHYLRGGESGSRRGLPTADRTNLEGSPIISPEKLYTLTVPQVAELKAKDPDLYKRSLEAWN